MTIRNLLTLLCTGSFLFTTGCDDSISSREMVENSIPHPTRFFVSKTEQSPWNLSYPSFGEVVDGIDVVSATQKGDWIKSIRIVGDPTAVLAPYADKIRTWDAALEKVKPPVRTKDEEGLPLPEGTRPVGF